MVNILEVGIMHSASFVSEELRENELFDLHVRCGRPRISLSSDSGLGLISIRQQKTLGTLFSKWILCQNQRVR